MNGAARLGEEGVTTGQRKRAQQADLFLSLNLDFLYFFDSSKWFLSTLIYQILRAKT